MEAQPNRLFEWLKSGDDVAWKRDAACRGYPIDVFFAGVSDGDYAYAKSICAKCSVVSECYKYNDEFEQIGNWRSGVYGGTTPMERQERERFRRMDYYKGPVDQCPSN